MAENGNGGRKTLAVTDQRTGQELELDILDGDVVRAIELRQLKVEEDDFGMMSYDPAFTNTASTRSKITFVDGQNGILRYRGYPIEQLAEQADFLEVAYLLLKGELPTQEAAVRYEKVLHCVFSHKNKEGAPRFDLILLGMGSDGHTASLFPETSVLEEREQWVAAPWVEKLHTHRITLTPPVFNAAKRVLFVVGGSDKDKAAEAVLEGPFQPNRYPAQIVNPGQGDVVWLLDREAACRLKGNLFTEWTRDSGKVM